MSNNQTTTKEISYLELLRLAEEAQSRKEAVRLIHLADKVRMEITNQKQDYPVIYG